MSNKIVTKDKQKFCYFFVTRWGPRDLEVQNTINWQKAKAVFCYQCALLCGKTHDRRKKDSCLAGQEPSLRPIMDQSLR